MCGRRAVCGRRRRCVIVLPDCGTTPEQSFGLAPGLPPERQWANRLAADGATVLAMALVDRRTGAPSPDGRTFRYSQREVLWRAAFEMGRTMAGYEIQTVLAAAAALRAGHPARHVTWSAAARAGISRCWPGRASPELRSVAIEGAFIRSTRCGNNRSTARFSVCCGHSAWRSWPR